jgi:hypothetical protein
MRTECGWKLVRIFSGSVEPWDSAVREVVKGGKLGLREIGC